MKFWLFFISYLVSVQCVWAEFNDPMRPPAYALEKFRLLKLKQTKRVIRKKIKSSAKDAWVLNSILYSSQRKHAIINDQLVKKGEMIKGAKLIRLKADSVRLLAKGKFIDLKIYADQPDIKLIKKSLAEKKI